MKKYKKSYDESLESDSSESESDSFIAKNFKLIYDEENLIFDKQTKKSYTKKESKNMDNNIENK